MLYGKLRPYLDKAILADRRGICSTDIIVLRAVEGRALPESLVNVLHTREFIDHAIRTTHGVNHPRTSWSSLRQFSLVLPPLVEQRRIARVLSTIQRAIEAQDKVMAAARELKRWLTKHLFAYGPVSITEASRVPLKETEMGFVPENWQLKELGEATEIVYGVQAAVAHLRDSTKGIPILTNVNITSEGTIDLSTLRYFEVPSQKRDRLILRRGDLLFNWRSGSKEQVGKTALFDLPGEFTFSSFILRLRTAEALNNRFLLYYLHRLRSTGYFAQKRQQSSVNSVFNASLTARLPVVLPSSSEQSQIG
jgi:type I restriction enzyme S subunit